MGVRFLSKRLWAVHEFRFEDFADKEFESQNNDKSTLEAGL